MVKHSLAPCAQFCVTRGDLGLLNQSVERDLENIRVDLDVVLSGFLHAEVLAFGLALLFDLDAGLDGLLIRHIHFTFQVVGVARMRGAISLHVHFFLHLLVAGVRARELHLVLLGRR